MTSKLTIAASPLPRIGNSMTWCQCCHVLIQKRYLLDSSSPGEAIATTFMRTSREISPNLKKNPKKDLTYYANRIKKRQLRTLNRLWNLHTKSYHLCIHKAKTIKKQEIQIVRNSNSHENYSARNITQTLIFCNHINSPEPKG